MQDLNQYKIVCDYKTKLSQISNGIAFPDYKNIKQLVDGINKI